MLGVGLGVRLLGAAAPAPPVPAPPGKAPLPLSSSSLRRRSSSWWFSNGNARERDSATASTSSRAARRKWWSDPELNQQEYGYSYQEEEEEEEDGFGDDDEAAFPGFGGGAELFDEPWFSKVFKTYGFLLPVMLVSMLVATGPKAFLMAMAIPLGQSAISFLLDAIWGRRRSNRDDRWRGPFQEVDDEEEEDYPEDATDFATGGRGNRYSRSSSYYEGRGKRRRQDNSQSWVSNDFADADSSTKGSSSEDGKGNKSSGNFGGWDELLNDDNFATQEKRRRSSFSDGNTDYIKRPRSAVTEDTDAAAASRGAGQGLGAPPARMRMRRQRGMPRTMGLGSTRYKQAPILMRLLVAVFPFLGSWFRLL
ncbi:hypothetical protein PAHAL_5G209100 [Panicum hallii]|uniref:Uncharacterized protein n=1 Tax=Panicum hallii TaxID=206008 RepID=A0A2S3HT77_9POAL|nr:uncharacterized protein LOC112894388 [Panicum hallii]PAN29205.1 hypothetical protein PAHAL_5G209100 [Panicum hallii]